MSVPLFAADDSRRAARGKVLLNLVSKTPKRSLKEWCAVSYFAAAFARDDGDWIGAELDLEAVETIEDLADSAQEEIEADSEFVVVLVEDEDWFAVVRVAGDASAEMYVSDAAEAFRSPIGEILVLDIGGFEAEDDDGDDGEVVVPAAPMGEPGLLTDLGLKSSDLVVLATGGSTSADAITEIAERIGAVDALEDVR
jgi:putative tRNA adenosine deaminase-associated protein